MTKTTCEGCFKGIDMCRERPCWGTPEDIKKIIEAGYRNRLMIDWWEGGIADKHNYGNIYMLAPAIKGYEGKKAPARPYGRCTFLTKEDKCELHDLGLKPTEGAVACCKNKGTGKTLHKEMAATWENEEAQKLYDK